MVDIMHGIAQDELPRGKQIGIVVNPPPNLEVKLNNIVLTHDQLYVTDSLLSGYTRHMVGETSNRAGGSGDAQYESHNHPIDNDETWTDTLRVGDLVSVDPIYGQNEQLYHITGRVVKL
jgi:hypothetical protein